ncbi:MAG: DUF3488 domain-containing protein [Verrucomicrobia bacterium]|jgi:hypothetical protein|nr:DUF3488 domain-containing protein [Verrucomicrobiota bacterium]
MSMAQKQARLSTEELHQLKQVMGALMALLAFWSLIPLDVGSGPVIFLGLVIAFVALVFPGFLSSVPAMTWKLAGPLLLLVIGADFVLSLPEFISPLVRMVVLLIIYRVLAPRNRREDLQVILLCLFCLVVAGVLTVSLLFAVQMLLFTPLAMALLFIICLLDRGEESKVHVIQWAHFRWSRLAKRVWQVFDVRIALLSAAMFGVVVTVSSLLFILTPRFDLNQNIPFLEMSTKAQSGFSEEVSLGDVTEIQEDNSIALRIDLPSRDVLPENAYWRMLVLDAYENGRFRASESLKTKPLRRSVEKRTLDSDMVFGADRTGTTGTIYMEGGISRYLPLPGDYSTVRFDKYKNVELVDAVNVVALDSVGQSWFSYQVEDLSFNQRFDAGKADAALFAGAESTESADIAKADEVRLAYPMTALKLNLSEEAVDTLQGINEGLNVEDSADAAAYSEAATEYLWQRFGYSLMPDGMGAGGDDPIISWLENGSRGHCELFAGAFVLLAREAGYPARMVVGFLGGSWNPVEDYLLVRNREAHAWVEIFDADQGNWLRVDPTPSASRGSSDPEIAFEGGMRFESGWFAWVDSLRIQWYRRVVNFEQEDQVELARGFKDSVTQFFDQLKEQLAGIGEFLKAFAASPFERGHIRAIVLILILVVFIYGAWRLRYFILGLLHSLVGDRQSLDPVRLRAARYLRRLRRIEADHALILELQALRFGPGRSMRSALPVFKQARKAVKRRKSVDEFSAAAPRT